ncbi:MAG: hypothetical protein ACREOV_06190, partial [Candidatus Dormibacteraceae bacterium]
MRAPSGAWTFSYSEVRPSVTRIPPLPAEWVRPLSDLAWEVGVTPVQIATFFRRLECRDEPGRTILRGGL